MKAKCPFKENTNICVYKRDKGVKISFCGYKNPELCPLLNKSKSELRKALVPSAEVLEEDVE